MRGVWDERIADGIAGLNLADEFTAAGESWSEADSGGTVTTHGPASGE